MNRARHKRQRGGSVIEVSLLLPWIIFLFAGAFDWGFSAHALISTETARVSALYGANAASGSVSSSTVCSLVLDELYIGSNVANLTSCATPGSINDTQPVGVSATCPGRLSAMGNLNTVQVQVAYRTIQLIPIPGLLSGKWTFTRTVQLPMANNTACTIV